MQSNHMHIYIDTPDYFIRKNNTDWKYMQKIKIIEEFSSIRTTYPVNHIDSALEAAHYIYNRFFVTDFMTPQNFRRSGWEIKAAAERCDAVLTHRRVPLAISRVPVIWQYAVLDPDMQMSDGRPADRIEKEYALQGDLYRRVAMVQVSTEAEARRHGARFPDLADRFFAVPFLLDHVRPVEAESVVRKHHADAPVRILFVGHEARRKGLDFVIAAVQQLHAARPGSVQLDIVSALTRWPDPPPDHPAIRYHGTLPQPQTLALMQQAHVFAMPSRLESYGFTFVEAMANGCAVIGPDWEVQRELMDDNAAGLLVRPEAAAIHEALARLVASRDLRLTLALAALQRYSDRYSIPRVAEAYERMVRAAITRFAAGH